LRIIPVSLSLLSDIFSIRKYTFNPIVNLKGGIAHRAPGFTMPGLDTLVQAKWAG
jgi:hypothetical protein